MAFTPNWRYCLGLVAGRRGDGRDVGNHPLPLRTRGLSSRFGAPERRASLDLVPRSEHILRRGPSTALKVRLRIGLEMAPPLTTAPYADGWEHDREPVG